MKNIDSVISQLSFFLEENGYVNSYFVSDKEISNSGYKYLSIFPKFHVRSKKSLQIEFSKKPSDYSFLPKRLIMLDYHEIDNLKHLFDFVNAVENFSRMSIASEIIHAMNFEASYICKSPDIVTKTIKGLEKEGFIFTQDYPCHFTPSCIFFSLDGYSYISIPHSNSIFVDANEVPSLEYWELLYKEGFLSFINPSSS